MSILTTYMTFQFIRLLVTKWEDTDAYARGIIDVEGKPLKKSRDLSYEDKEVYTSFHRLVFKLKRMLEKVPFGKTIMASYIAALSLIKEHVKNKAEFDTILEEFCKHVGYDPKDNKQLTEELADNNILEPGRYIVVSEHLDGLIKQEILYIDESLKPVDCILGFPVYSYQGHPFTQFDVFKLEEGILYEQKLTSWEKRERQLAKNAAMRAFNKNKLKQKSTFKPLTTQVMSPKKVEEDVNVVGGGAIAGANGDPPGPAKLTKLIRRKKFAGMEVFECSDEVYHRCLFGKPKFHRYSTYVGEDEIGQAIREYGLEARKQPIVLQNEKTGHMIYLRRSGK